MVITTFPLSASACSVTVVAAESHGVANTMTSRWAAAALSPPARLS